MVPRPGLRLLGLTVIGVVGGTVVCGLLLYLADKGCVRGPYAWTCESVGTELSLDTGQDVDTIFMFAP